MHIWGGLALHPMTLPIAEQVAHMVSTSLRYGYAVYGAVLQPTVDDFRFLLSHL